MKRTENDMNSNNMNLIPADPSAIIADEGVIAAKGNIDGFGTWTLYEDGSLLLDGNGEIPDCESAAAQPWYNLKNRILTARLSGNVYGIGAYIFAGCTSLHEITLRSRIRGIERYTFAGCTSLQRITIPGFAAFIRQGAFEGCTSLREVEIPGMLFSIGDTAFSGCSSLCKIDLPDTVTDIGDAAFRGCRSLEEFIIPGSVSTIGKDAFISCDNLRKLTMPARFRCADFEEKYGCPTDIVTFI